MQDAISFHPPSGDRPTVVVGTAPRDALVADLAARMARGTGFSVATLNLDHVLKLRRLPEFRAAYLRHSHVTADGRPIVWLHRLAGRPVPLVPGSELIAPLVAEAARLDVPVALFGSSEAVLTAAAGRLQAENPGLAIVERIAPPYGLDPMGDAAGACLDRIAASGAGLCFLAFGAPKQEILARRGAAMMPDTGFVSIGAGLDFIAGHERRAPAWMRRLALEWAWRLALNPRRLARRYLECFLALPGLGRAALKARLTATPGPD